MKDLEHFPENEVAKRMLSMVSPVYDKAYVGKWMFEIIGRMMSSPYDLITSMEQETAPDTATWSLQIWESMYRIQSNPSLSDEQRRVKILERRNFKRPMNPARIEGLITSGSGRKAKVIENTAPNTYEICIFPGESEVSLDRVIEIAKNVKQSNKHVDIVFEVPTTIRIRADPEISGMSYPHVLAGIRPDVNVQGISNPVNIEANMIITAEKIPYTSSGTKNAGTTPDVNMPGVSDIPGLTAGVTMTTGNAAFKVCGAVGLKRGG